MAQQVQEQRTQSVQQAQIAKQEQDRLAQQVADAQRSAATSAAIARRYEEQLTSLSEKMVTLECILIEQRQKGQHLESELSSAQDRNGGTQRRAQLLEAENIKIKGELESWNQYYNQEETSPEFPVSVSMSTPLSIPAESSLFNFTSPMTMPTPGMSFGTPVSDVMCGPSLVTSHPIVSFPSEASRWSELNPENIRQRQSQGRRVSFGSTFPGSNGSGNGNGNGMSGAGVTGTSQRMMPSQSATFNIGIKPKEPPVFSGKAKEDVDTWLAKVGDFIYLTEANDRQQVAYIWLLCCKVPLQIGGQHY